MMEEWIIGSRVPFVGDAVVQVMTTNNHVRECRRMADRDWSTLWFTDCAHPAQNAICNESDIAAWRLKTVGASTPATPEN